MEIEGSENQIPELNPDVEIFPFNDGYILVQCNGHQLKIRKSLEQLIALVDGKRTLEAITGEFNRLTNQQLPVLVIQNFLNRELAAYGIVKSERKLKVRERSLHLRLSFIFWKGKSLNTVSRLFFPLLTPAFFYAGLGAMFLFSAFMLLVFAPEPGIGILKEFNPIVYLAISFAILMLHELGHVAACTRFGAKHQGIGFGFYLFSPVFFADVSDTWKLPRSQRIIVNLGGIFIEFIIATGVLAGLLICHSAVLYYIGFAIVLHILLNLNPFLKFDGYWIVSDLTNTTNLRTKSAMLLKDCLNPAKRKRFSISDLVLVVYALLSYLLMGLVLFLLFIRDPELILSYPGNLVHALSTCRVNDFSISSIGPALLRGLVPMLFYFILVRSIYQFFKRRLKPATDEN